MRDLDWRMRPPQKTSIGAAVSLEDSDRFHAIAAKQQKSLSRLIVDTLNRAYPKDEPQK